MLPSIILSLCVGIKNSVIGDFWKVNFGELADYGSTNCTSQFVVTFCVKVIRRFYMVLMMWNSGTVVLSVKFLSVICYYFQDKSLNTDLVLQ